MPYAIQAHLDEATDRFVRDLWRRQAAAGLPSRPIEHNHFPHLTFAYGEMPSQHTFKWDWLRDRRPVPVLLCAVETFGSDSGVVFLAAADSAPLLELHRAIDAHAPFSSFSDLYRPGRWRPHCTLGTRLSREDLARALEVLKDVELPVEATCVSINLVRYPASELISSVGLNASG